MHLQATEPNWIDALLLMPDYAVVKGFDAGILKDAKLKWTAGGRDPARLYTVMRHHDLQTTPHTDWDGAVAHWRTMFPRFVDATYRSEFAPFVDFVQGANEYTATSTWQNPMDKAWALQNDRAMAWVWNNDYRGKGGIPAHCKVTLLSGPVSNDVPLEIVQLAVEQDCPIAYHAYTRYFQGARFGQDWEHDSGRWHFHETAYGLKPEWFFGECGPYMNAENGWRHPDVLNADRDALVAAMRAWWLDCAQTPAYKQGRLIGPGAWFTSGHVGWQFYQLETDDLKALARAAAEVWHPGQGDDEMADLEKIRGWAQEIGVLAAKIEAEAAPPPWWDKPTPYVFKALPVNPLKLYKNDKVTVGVSLNYQGWTITVSAVDPAGWLKVVDPAGDAGDLWVRAGDVTPA